MKALPLNSVRNRLVLMFFLTTAGAVAFVYLYVVPQLRSSLTAEKLHRLEQEGPEEIQPLANAAAEDPAPDQAELGRLIERIGRRSDARVSLLGVRRSAAGYVPSFVIADSDSERSAVAPSYPAAAAALQTATQASAVETVSGRPVGQTAFPISTEDLPVWVAVLSTSLAEVDDNVALIKRQILIAGAIALLAAGAAGWFAARAHSRRLRRLEKAAEEVAEGNFQATIPIDSSDEVGQLALTFNEMQKRLARLDSARKEFIANASHELRTPIFSLGGFVELLEHEDPDPAVRAEFVLTMREQVERLTKLTADLLDLSKLDADALELVSGAVDLSELARRTAAEFGPAAEGHRSSLRVRGGDGAVAFGDPDRVAQILRILIDNALRHTPEGTTISVDAQLQDSAASLTVRDDGPGIDRRSRDRVFERFYTGDDVGGSGLGLAIARELALRMGGELELSSRRGRTEFTLRLRAASGARA